ncbi:MAG: cytochrome oxidase assembly protein [Candidatus Nitrosopolaris wilkensis]|nr:MAG: cytochrome oxidase assembly protein [Candidatus Nitrosopolaris wilkensis]
MLLKTLAVASLCSLFVLIFIGGYVSASGVGLTCPRWPLCPAGLVPTNEFIIEYFHRSVAATTALLVIVTMAFTLRSKLSLSGMKMSSMIASAAAIGQISLGAAVIVERLHATLVTTHLGLGLVMFSMTLITTMYAYKLPPEDTKKKNTVAGAKIDL